MTKTAIKIPTFWFENHPLSAQRDILFDKLVPAFGSCDTLQGELLLAANKISHDYFNNGWGNNWSGSLMYLKKYFRMLCTSPQPLGAEFNAALSLIEPFACGSMAAYAFVNDEDIVAAITLIEQEVVQAILDNQTEIKNPSSIFDLQKPDEETPEEAPEEYEEEDDEDYEYEVFVEDELC